MDIDEQSGMLNRLGDKNKARRDDACDHGLSRS